MGNLFIKKSEQTNKWEKEFENLKNKIDQNNDNLISKKEFNDWEKEYKKVKDREFDTLSEDIKNKLDKEYQDKISDYKNKINEYEKKIQNLNDQIIFLKKKDATLSIVIGEENDQNEISKEKIHKFVDKLLENKDININLLPDGVERAIYNNVIILVMEIFKNTLDTCSISFMGHEIKPIIKPINLRTTVEYDSQKDGKEGCEENINQEISKTKTSHTPHNSHNPFKNLF